MLWPLVLLAAVLAAWHRVGQWLDARALVSAQAERLDALEATRADSERRLEELAGRMGKAEMALRER